MICSEAQVFCNDYILTPLSGEWDEYYVPSAKPDLYPPDLTAYLDSSNVTSVIGSQNTWSQSNYNIYNQFLAGGDWMRSQLPNLEMVINSGVRTVIYDGDADYICNYMGVESMVRLSFFLLLHLLPLLLTFAMTLSMHA